MQTVVIDETYEFVPPYRGTGWARGLQMIMPWWLRRSYGIESLQCEGLEHLKTSMNAGHGILLAANHCRPADPSVINEMCHRVGLVPNMMASWHLFKQNWLQKFILRRVGAFSVYREGLDRQALQAGVDILAEARRPLVIFPEGVITRTNDRLLPLMDGVSFIARSAAKKRAALNPPGQVVVHPIGIRYQFHGNIDEAVHQTLDEIERGLSWRPKRDADCVRRIYRVGEALLWLKEIEYLGRPQTGPIPDRLERLINGILVPLEDEWLGGQKEGTFVNRVKQLRIAILRDMVSGDLPEDEKKRRWDQLADMYIAQQLGHYPPEYVKSSRSKERLLETVEKFEEDLTDTSQIHRPMSATVRIGPAIPVAAKRDRKAAEDPVMAAIEQQLHQLLDLPAPTSGINSNANAQETDTQAQSPASDTQPADT